MLWKSVEEPPLLRKVELISDSLSTLVFGTLETTL